MKNYTKAFMFLNDFEGQGMKLTKDFEEGALRFGNWLDETNKQLKVVAEEQKEEEIPIVSEEEWTNEDDNARSLGIKGST